MKKRKEDKPLEYFERSYLLLTLFIVVTIVLSYESYVLIMDFNPIGLVLGVPALILFFQTLWLILNPYAIIYENKFEIKRSIINSKIWYFLDIKQVGESDARGFIIRYNDDDPERVSDFGIRPSHKKKFRDVVNHHVCKSLVERDD